VRELTHAHGNAIALGPGQHMAAIVIAAMLAAARNELSGKPWPDETHNHIACAR